VRDRIFATLWTDTAMNVMAGEARILTAVDEAPHACSEVHWGARLAAVRVELPDVEPDLLADLLATAWVRKAPKALVASAGLPPR
jgi:hypothetical protein